jgi:hypothetical protein
MTTATHNFTDMGTISCKFKAGTYVITDPCYVFPDEMWSDLCSKIFCREDENKECPDTGVIEMDGHQIWWGHTAHGDGSYAVRVDGAKVGEFCVDAGMFAIFPVAFVQKYRPEMVDSPELATTLSIMGGVVEYDGGDMDCGRVSVCTSESDEDDDDDGDGEDD